MSADQTCKTKTYGQNCNCTPTVSVCHCTAAACGSPLYDFRDVLLLHSEAECFFGRLLRALRFGACATNAAPLRSMATTHLDDCSTSVLGYPSYVIKTLASNEIAAAMGRLTHTLLGACIDDAVPKNVLVMHAMAPVHTFKAHFRVHDACMIGISEGLSKPGQASTRALQTTRLLPANAVAQSPLSHPGYQPFLALSAILHECRYK